MPNFHKNQLVIAASEADMMSVLRCMAANLAANAQATQFDLAKIGDIDDPEQLYRKLAPVIERWYTQVFCGAPVGSEGYIPFASGIDLGHGAALSVAVAPAGRATDISSTVFMEQCGDVLVLFMRYETAWTANDGDVNALFASLPEGAYGYSFFGADEYDDYQLSNACWGVSNGHSDGKPPLESPEVMSRRKIGSLKGAASKKNRDELSDVGEIARITGLRNWQNANWFNKPSDGVLISAEAPIEEDGADEDIVDFLERFPITAKVKTSFSNISACNDALRGMLVGDPLMLHVRSLEAHSMDACTVDGLPLGIVRIIGDSFSKEDDDARTILSYMLPFVKARLAYYQPVLRKDGEEGAPEVRVTIEMAKFNLQAILENAHSIRREGDLKEGLRSSIVEEVR